MEHIEASLSLGFMNSDYFRAATEALAESVGVERFTWIVSSDTPELKLVIGDVSYGTNPDGSPEFIPDEEYARRGCGIYLADTLWEACLKAGMREEVLTKHLEKQ